MKHALIVFVAVAALVFVGCSGSDSSSSPATTSPTLASDSNTPSADGSGTPDTAASSDSNSDSQAADSSVAADVDPCSLLTTAEIKDAAGFEVAEGQASDAPMGSKACSYFGKQSADELVMVEPQEVWQHFFDLGPSTPGQSGGALTIKKISGIGDSAYSKAPTNGERATRCTPASRSQVPTSSSGSR